MRLRSKSGDPEPPHRYLVPPRSRKAL